MGKNEGCGRCHEVCLTQEIRLPGGLSKALAVINANLDDGTIVESDYWPEGTVRCFNDIPFRSLPVEGALPDGLLYYFECPVCGQLFRLSVDIYHGSGGDWRPVERE